MKKDITRGNKKAEPNLRTYNILIDVWSKSAEKNAPSRARAILNTIVAESNTKRNLRPDTIAYNSVLNAHVKHGDVEGAAEVFEMMKNDHYSGNKNAKPNAITNSILMEVWSKSTNQDTQRQAHNVLDASTAEVKQIERKV
mmetsp:Transcript_2044/g.4430  ORF Transcript_2044/g.4430 Transcript_2044/m.4430 type:complete len:141 (+) Transcript_2044:1-423(+)